MEINRPKIRLQILKHLIDYCSLKNINRNELLKIAGIDESFLLQNTLYIPLEPFERIVVYLDAMLIDPLWLFKVFLKDDSPLTGVLGILLNVSSSLREAIYTGYKYRSLNGEMGDEMVVEENGSNILLKWRKISGNSDFINKAIEYKCAWWANFIKFNFCDGNKYLDYVCFEHELKKGVDIEIYIDFFGCDVKFLQSETILAISKDALELPIKNANKDLYRNIENYISSALIAVEPEKEIVNKVKNTIYCQMHLKSVSREIVAEKLGMNVRTLTRKLHDNGSKYSLILEEVRVDLAIDCLKNTNYKLKDISQMLGFFTVNSFITWFKSVKGVTPRKFREQNNFN